MLTSLRILFAGILIAMLALTTMASQERNILEAAATLWGDGWFRATLADAYFGFVTVFVWIAYKERSLASRVLWFVLLMTLGNIAVSIYILIQLNRLRLGDPVQRVLLRSA